MWEFGVWFQNPIAGWAEVLRKGRVWRCPMLWDLCPWVSKLRGPEGGGSHVEGIFRMRGESKYGRRGPKIVGQIQRNI